MPNPFPLDDAGMSGGLSLNDLGAILRRGLERREHDLASDYQMEIKQQLEEFRRSVPEGHEVMLEVVLPDGYHAPEVYEVGYINPNMLWLDCISDDGELSRILAPHAHVTLRLRAAVPEPDEPRKPIGFMAQPTGNSLPSGDRQPTG